MKQHHVRRVAGLLIASLLLSGCVVLDEMAFARALLRDGGLRAVFAADHDLDAQDTEVVTTIIESRLGGLGLGEYRVRPVDGRRFVVELVGVADQELVLATVEHTGLLEFVAFGYDALPADTVVRTDCHAAGGACLAAGEGGAPSSETADEAPGPVYHTVMTGSALSDAAPVAPDASARRTDWSVEITLTPEGQAIFSDYTASHIGEVLGIVIDGRVITAPRIQQAITAESVLLTGRFTAEEARALAIQLRYGALPVPLALESVEVFAPAEAE